MFPFASQSRRIPKPATHCEPESGEYWESDRDATYELLTVSEAYWFARSMLVRRDDLGRIVHRPTPAEALRFARVAVGGCKTLAGWRAVLGAPSAFRMVRKAG